MQPTDSYDVTGTRAVFEPAGPIDAEVLTRADVRADLEAQGLRVDQLPERARLFTISDQSVDSYRTWFLQKGGNLKRHRANPVVLFGHDSDALPVAKALSTFVDESKGKPRTRSIAEFAPAEANPMAEWALRSIDFGSLRGASIGFSDAVWAPDPEQERIAYAKSWTLNEWSVVPIPSNANALKDARAAGIDPKPVLEWAERILDTRSVRRTPGNVVACAHQAWRILGREVLTMAVEVDTAQLERAAATVEALTARLEAALTRAESATLPAPSPVLAQPARVALNKSELAAAIAAAFTGKEIK